MVLVVTTCVVIDVSELMLAMASAFAQPKKDGGPNVKFYESPETAQLFEGIKSWLVKNCKKV